MTTYPAAPSRVFAAFASAEAKDTCGDTGGLESADGEAGIKEFDFPPGGRERFGVRYEGRTLRYDSLYYDIVPDQRIVYSYEMYADDARISVSVAAIEFAKSGDGTALTRSTACCLDRSRPVQLTRMVSRDALCRTRPPRRLCTGPRELAPRRG